RRFFVELGLVGLVLRLLLELRALALVLRALLLRLRAGAEAADVGLLAADCGVADLVRLELQRAAVGAPRAVAARPALPLLDHVRQLVRQERPPLLRRQVALARREVDVLPLGVGLRAHSGDALVAVDTD